MNQIALNDNFIFAAEHGDIAEVTICLVGGADILTHDDRGLNALDIAAEHGHLQLAEWLLKNRFGGNPIFPGKALISAKEPDMIRLLAKWSADTSITNEKGFHARDIMVLHGDYELIDAYDECGLLKPPLNTKLLRHINKSCCLKKWSALMGKAIPAEFDKRLNDLMKDYPYDQRRHRKLYQYIIEEVSKSA